jgi:two-component system chemotaxis response regulator CheB
VQALGKVLSALPADLAAAIFIVLHVRPDAPSQLPAILNRIGRLPAAHAVDGEPIRQGRVYIAPPGQQMYVHNGRLAVRHGPRENMHRPAIDPLFRTAAHQYGPRVIGVVLSGAMDDGSAGLLAVKHAGGIAVVQDPDDAEVRSMPANALERVEVDYRMNADELGALLTCLVSGDAAPGALPSEVPLETVEEAERPKEARRSEELGVPASFTCPECAGSLWEIDEGGGTARYRCRVGHAYSQETMIAAQGDAVERALWVALRALEERVALMHKLASRARQRGLETVAAMFDERSREFDGDVRTIHDLITAGNSLEAVVEEDV